jgi:hypothetical protein
MSVRAAWLTVFVLTLGLYAATANRGVQWGDSTHLMYRIATGEVVHPLGLALSHPLHYWLGRGAVLLAGPHPLVTTLISALAGALAVASVLGCVFTLTRRIGPALFAAASLALASTFWRVSTMTEVYSVSAALLASSCWCFAVYGRDRAPWALWTACLLNGLGGANDLQSGLATPVLAAAVVYELRAGRIRPIDSGLAAGAWLVGVMPYGGLVIAELIASGDLAATLRSALFGKMWADQVLGGGLSLRVLLIDIGYPLLNFPNLLLPAAAYGLWRARDMGVPVLVRWTFTAILIVQALFALRYEIEEQYNFFIPLYVLLAIFGGIGAAAALQWPRARRWLPGVALALLALTPVAYAGAAAFSRHFDVLQRFTRNKPYRDDYVYLIIPWAVAERSADVMSRQALHLAGDEGVIIFEDWMARYPVLHSAIVEHRSKPTLLWWESEEAARAMSAAAAARRPVVLVPRDRDQPQSRPPVGGWRREGDLYVLTYP